MPPKEELDRADLVPVEAQHHSSRGKPLGQTIKGREMQEALRFGGRPFCYRGSRFVVASGRRLGNKTS